MKTTTSWGAVVLLVAVVLIALYFYLPDIMRQPASVPVASAPPPVQDQPSIRHPIEKAQVQPLPSAEDAQPLPPLAESDEPALTAAQRLVGRESLERYFYLDSLMRRVVVTIDNLPRKQVPERYRLTKPIGGRFVVTEERETTFLNPKNYARYAPAVLFFEGIDTKKLVATYVRFYALLQQEYQNLGRPDGYFNDRTVEAIDDMLAAPELHQPIQLVRPNVWYKFADPELEALSAGQKLMIRIGPENAARVKAKLRDIRRELTGTAERPAPAP
ncbi:MAG: DUF3014 domain-containing protein [Gammaproteobacteria bacterium]